MSERVAPCRLAFAGEIDGEYYWDGGVVTNTPITYVVDENH